MLVDFSHARPGGEGGIGWIAFVLYFHAVHVVAHGDLRQRLLSVFLTQFDQSSPMTGGVVTVMQTQPRAIERCDISVPLDFAAAATLIVLISGVDCKSPFTARGRRIVLDLETLRQHSLPLALFMDATDFILVVLSPTHAFTEVKRRRLLDQPPAATGIGI